MDKQDRANISRIMSNRQRHLRGLSLPEYEPGIDVDILLAIIDRLLARVSDLAQRMSELR